MRDTARSLNFGHPIGPHLASARTAPKNYHEEDIQCAAKRYPHLGFLREMLHAKHAKRHLIAFIYCKVTEFSV